MSDMAAFDDLLAANRSYAEHFDLAGFDGVAHAGVAMVTCMDSRIDPLRMIGLRAGDAKILRVRHGDLQLAGAAATGQRVRRAGCELGRAGCGTRPGGGPAGGRGAGSLAPASR